MNTPQQLVTDSSGNIWLVNFTLQSSISEIIGLATPVLTPLEACLTQATPHAVCLP
jgi:hypothetical protein